MKTVLVVFGTRPEAIKMCPVVKALEAHSSINAIVCVTGQHREMLDQALEAFNVQPQYDLAVMKQGQSLFGITNEVLKRMGDVINETKPDVVLVHGDTTTSFATALASFYLQVPVGHVEAGLRTYNIRSPFPEEFNRQSVDAISEFLFAPTETSKRNLIAEGKDANRVYVTGNTVIDALATTVSSSFNHPALEWASDSRLILVTAHRRENIGGPMRAMFAALKRIVDETPDVKIVYPVHLNPAVRAMADEMLGNHARIRLIEPLDVLEFHNIMARSHLILTDSGGVQEEAPSLGKPVLVMRDTTERPEGIEAGTLRLVGTAQDSVYEGCRTLLNDASAYDAMAKASNPYGDGHASERIASILAESLEGN